MSDFVSNDMLPDLWEEILRRHWTFLETEENIQKLEERKKLEGCLKEFLCLVPYDRKFFLPETAHVLKKSIRELDDFTAYKAIIGFESISQYANNLFTKPWRKEFRVLKTYSGFFQHEIKSNLLDAEKLFEAMGYRRLSDELLILDGPICPDQVTNVSRDTMAAYVECQIVKRIYMELMDRGLPCAWQDVFDYRERSIGGCSTAIKALAYTIQDRCLRRENAENCYATIKHTPHAPTGPSLYTPQCQNCSTFCKSQPLYMQHQQQRQHSGKACALHPNLMYNGINQEENGDKLIDTYAAPNYQQHPFTKLSTQLPHMSHSRSLEHYNEPQTLLPHRHSFDHPQHGMADQYTHPAHHQNVYESPYDCIDGVSMGSSVSYAAPAVNCNMNAAYAHSYNVSGNRYPLPFNISNQLNTHYTTPQVSCNGIKSNVGNVYATSMKVMHNCNYHTQPPLPPMRHISTADNTKSCFPSEHFIEFDDCAPLTSHDFHAQNTYADNELMYKHQNMMRTKFNGMYAQTTDVLCQHTAASPETKVRAGSQYGPNMAGLMSKNAVDKYLRKQDYVQDYDDGKKRNRADVKSRFVNNDISGKRHVIEIYTNERDSSDMSNESMLDDYVTVGHSEKPQRSPTQATKNQDGVGSFERWNYVFQNLDRKGCAKDTSDQDDLLMQSLDLDALNLTNGTNTVVSEKRRVNQQSDSKGPALRQAVNAENPRTLEKDMEKRDSSKSSAKQEKSKPKPLNKNTINKGEKKINKLVKLPAASSLSVNNNNNHSDGNKNCIEYAACNTRKNEHTIARRQSEKLQANTSMQVIVSSPNEWSCPFCTFLNTNAKNICEICCRTKDFNLKESVSQTPTCV